MKDLKNLKQDKCESCDAEYPWPTLVTLVMIGEAIKYKICLTCLQKLVTYSLSPENYKNLLKAGHSVDEFYLHGDFYDEAGNALQPYFGGD